MMRHRIAVKFIIFLFAMLAAADVSAQKRGDTSVVSLRDSVMINFRQSKWDLDRSIGDNAAALDGINRRLTDVFNDSVYRLRRVMVFGGASPEGSVAFNKFLSEHRAATLFGWFDGYGQLADTDKTFTFFGRDWEGVLRIAEADPQLPYRDETLELLRTIAGEKRAAGGEEPRQSLERMKALRGGAPYRYLYKNVFPKVRASKVVIDYERVLAPDRIPAVNVVRRDTVYIERTVEVRDTLYIDLCGKGGGKR